MSRIILSRLDHARILESIKSKGNTLNAAEAEKLIGELNAATIVDPQEIPADVVTMNSVVKIKFLNIKKEVQFRIVYPHDADIKQNKISIFSPVATALIGYKKGDEIEWIVPSGITRIRIEDIIYQPEAAGDYNL